jgi:hypothetical protein
MVASANMQLHIIVQVQMVDAVVVVEAMVFRESFAALLLTVSSSF